MANGKTYTIELTAAERAWLRDAAEMMLRGLDTVAHCIENEADYNDALAQIAAGEAIIKKL